MRAVVPVLVRAVREPVQGGAQIDVQWFVRVAKEHVKEVAGEHVVENNFIRYAILNNISKTN